MAVNRGCSPADAARFLCVHIALLDGVLTRRFMRMLRRSCAQWSSNVYVDDDDTRLKAAKAELTLTLRLDGLISSNHLPL